MLRQGIRFPLARFAVVSGVMLLAVCLVGAALLVQALWCARITV